MEEAILDSVSLSEDAVRLSSRNSAPQSEVDELMKDSEVNELMEQYETIVRKFGGSVTPDDKSKLSYSCDLSQDEEYNSRSAVFLHQPVCKTLLRDETSTQYIVILQKTLQCPTSEAQALHWEPLTEKDLIVNVALVTTISKSLPVHKNDRVYVFSPNGMFYPSFF